MYIIKENGKTYDCKYPHHWVKGNELLLHKGGLNAAWAAAQGARSGQKASPEIISHLEAHRKALGLDKEKPKKEVRNMDLQELKETHPEIVKAIAEEAKASVSGEVEGIKAKVTALTEENGKLAAENKELSKQVTIQQEAANKAAAEGVQKEVLGASDIAAHLHAKVVKHSLVEAKDHMKDGKFDAEGFKIAFTAEVEGWANDLSSTTTAGAGVGDSRVDTPVGDKVDMETINKVLSM